MGIIQLDEISIEVVRKGVKNVHLSVHPPNGRVTLVVPTSTRDEVARAFAISKIGWIRKNIHKLQFQPREAPRKFVGRETHYLWGRRYLLRLLEVDAKPVVWLDHRTICLQVRPGADHAQRSKIMNDWHLKILHEVVPPIIAKWETVVGVDVRGYYLQRMVTRWGGCNSTKRTIRLNTELIKKPRDLLEYVVVREILHIIEPGIGDKYYSLLSKYYPGWLESRRELNDLPIPAPFR